MSILKVIDFVQMHPSMLFFLQAFFTSFLNGKEGQIRRALARIAPSPAEFAALPDKEKQKANEFGPLRDSLLLFVTEGLAQVRGSSGKMERRVAFMEKVLRAAPMTI